MYRTKHNEQHDLQVLHDLIRHYPLGAWLTSCDHNGLRVEHIPFLLDTQQGEFGTLRGHVARGNDIWKQLTESRNSMVIFQGCDAYISPSWYPSKQLEGKAVPTWNYVVVHAHGQARLIDDRAWLLAHVNELTATHEADQSPPWQIADAPVDYIDRLVGAIVGIEIPISELMGKWKVSQNRTTEDKLGIVEGLLARGDARSMEMAGLVKQFGGLTALK